MKRNIIFFIIIGYAIVFAGCTKDNYNKPTSMITGRIVYENSPVNVRTPTVTNGTVSSGVQLELWQHGYQLYSKVQVLIAQDGSFSAEMPDGDYKLIPLKGNGPWVDKLDSIDVHLQGSANIDIPVTPFFTVKSDTYTFNKADTTISVTFNINQVVQGKTVDKISFSVFSTQFVDINNQIAFASIDGNPPANITQPVTLKIDVRPNKYTLPTQADTKRLLGDIIYKKYCYVRIGVKTTGVTERIYSTVKKIDIQ